MKRRRPQIERHRAWLRVKIREAVEAAHASEGGTNDRYFYVFDLLTEEANFDAPTRNELHTRMQMTREAEHG